MSIPKYRFVIKYTDIFYWTRLIFAYTIKEKCIKGDKMNKRNWKILYSTYTGMQKKAIELVSAEVGKTILRDKGVY